MADVRESLEQLAYAAGPWIEETRVKLGQGHYGTVYAVKIRGLQCAGKKFDARLLEKPAGGQRGADGATTGQVLAEQCLQLAQVRHPNIVQLLGVLFDGNSVPTLVSEVLPLNLAKCLEDYQHMPAYAKSSVLLDVANGLRFAHELKRPMVHGRLCPEKVLLTISLQAKICGFVNPSGIALPDSSYAAPEVAESGSLTAKGDVFSFGNLVLHVVTQQYPQPTPKERLDPADAGRTIACSEVERRDHSLRELGESHALLGLAKRCLEDSSDSRPPMAEVLQEVEQHAVSTPPPYASVLQVMQEVEQAALLKENIASLTQTLEGKQTELDAKQLEVDGLTQELEVKEKAFLACKDELDAYKQTVHSKERRMQMHDQALRAKDSLIKAKAREIVAKNQQLAGKDSQLAAANRRIATLEERLSSGKGHGLRYPVTPQHRSPSRSPAFTRSQQVSPTFKESPYKFSQSAEAEDVAVKAGEVLRRATPGRRGKTVPMSDGFFFQNKFEPPKTGIYGQQQVDPRLALILAKRHQRYTEIETAEAPKHLEPGQQTAGTESTSDQVQLRKQVENRLHRSASATGSSMSPELQKLMNKRRSQIDMDPAECPPAVVQSKPAPPPTAPRRRQDTSPAKDNSPPSVEQQQPEQPEPSTTSQPEPSTTSQPEPSTTSQPEPSTTSQPEPSTTSQPEQPEPSTTSQPEPSTTSQPEPSTTYQSEPSTTSQPEPSTTSQPEPSTTSQPEQPEPSTTSQPEPSTTYQSEPSTTSQPEPATTSQPEPSTTSQPESSTTSQPEQSQAETHEEKQEPSLGEEQPPQQEREPSLTNHQEEQEPSSEQREPGSTATETEV